MLAPRVDASGPTSVRMSGMPKSRGRPKGRGRPKVRASSGAVAQPSLAVLALRDAGRITAGRDSLDAEKWGPPA